MTKSNLNYFILLFTGLAIGFSSCEKDGPDPDTDSSGSGCAYLLTKEDIVIVDSTNGNSQTTATLTYTYNSSNKLVKLIKSAGGTLMGYDTILYTTGGEVDSVKSYTAGGTLEVSKEFTYSSGRISSIKEAVTGTTSYTRTAAYTYNGSGQLTDMNVSYQVGNFDDEEIEAITGITYTNGNITGGNVDMFGTPVNPPAVPATIEYETTAPNPYKGSVILEPVKIPELFSANNMTKAYPTGSPTTPFIENEYTYENGRVKTLSTGSVGQYSEVRTLTYECK